VNCTSKTSAHIKPSHWEAEPSHLQSSDGRGLPGPKRATARIRSLNLGNLNDST
jgi:hypothetical protein